MQAEKDSGPVLKVDRLSKRLGNRLAVAEISFDVLRGGTLGILGPSGCGKTTILRLIAGLESPDAGNIWFGDRLASEPRHVRLPPAQRNIGFVFQDLALWPHMTVNGNLLFVLESRQWPAHTRQARVREMLKIVGLEGRDGDYPGYLSGGEQQRVALARALVSQPDLLLLDEPLSSLDRERRESLRLEIAAIPKALGITLSYVTHDHDDARAFGGEILKIPAPD
jgi:iron(III) transport system ATP-binding protein